MPALLYLLTLLANDLSELLLRRWVDDGWEEEASGTLFHQFSFDSVLISARLGESDRENISGEGALSLLKLRAGILRFSGNKREALDPELASFDDSALVGLSTSVLKRLSITSGFLVVAIEPSDDVVLRVNHTQTALVLGGSVPSAVPPDQLLSGREGFTPLQGDTVKILASILTPPICPSALSSKFRVAVLLYSLAGCGKRTVVKYFCQRLGLHLVEFSCHNLVTSSEKKTSVALAEAFNMAQRYSPSILLLRHFDVFPKFGVSGGFFK